MGRYAYLANSQGAPSTIRCIKTMNLNTARRLRRCQGASSTIRCIKTLAV